jgi:proline dehydrogenase
MLRSAILATARSVRARSLIETLPVTRSVVERFVAGAEPADAVRVTRSLLADGRRVSLDHLGEDTTDRARAEATVHAYEAVLAALADAGAGVDLSVKLSAVGQNLPADGEKIALENARTICAAASRAGATVTLDMEDHTTTDSTLGILGELRADFPWVGAVLQAYLRRTEQDCRDLSGAGSRVRLCKGAYAEPASVAYQDKDDVDRSYARCLGILMRGAGYPMVASHDPAIIELAGRLATRYERGRADYEYQMLYGIRPAEQRRIASEGDTMRVYVPYGEEWYGYFMRRLAERPANLAFFLRSLATKS